MTIRESESLRKHKRGSVRIREVWADNLEEELKMIKDIVEQKQYLYVALDTEFPGFVQKTVWNASRNTFKKRSEATYEDLKANVDALNPIQLGLTFSDKDGNLPCRFAGAGADADSDDNNHFECYVWQFNFKFNENDDLHEISAIEFLKKNGIDLEKNKEKGIDTAKFGALLKSSGIVSNKDFRWITFHGNYDFGYLLKLLTTPNKLPATQEGFLRLLRVHFPALYDVKYLMRFSKCFRGGLSAFAEGLRVDRIGSIGEINYL